MAGARYDTGKKVPPPVEGFSAQPDARMIRKGLPDAEDLLVFDNEAERGHLPLDPAAVCGARALGIDPATRRDRRRYVGTKRTLFSPFIGAARRLANADTLIGGGTRARLVRVSAAAKGIRQHLPPFAGRGWARS